MSDDTAVRHAAVRCLTAFWRNAFIGMACTAVGVMASMWLSQVLSRNATAVEWWHILVLILPVMPGVVFAGVSAFRHKKARRAQRFLLDQCPWCGYAMEGRSDPCPECGRDAASGKEF